MYIKLRNFRRAHFAESAYQNNYFSFPRGSFLLPYFLSLSHFVLSRDLAYERQQFSIFPRVAALIFRQKAKRPSILKDSRVGTSAHRTLAKINNRNT